MGMCPSCSCLGELDTNASFRAHSRGTIPGQNSCSGVISLNLVMHCFARS